MRVLALLLLASAPAAFAQAPLPPGKDGYAYPPGGTAGSTVEVILGGTDWTPDTQFFVHDPRVKLAVASKPGPVLMPEPPHWFGIQSYANDPRLPREVVARFEIPKDFPPGPIHWSAANANGGGPGGVFVVGTGTEVLEDENRREPQELPALPVTVNGRLRRIEEVDHYRFKAAKAGPITCELMARQLGGDFHAVVEVRDDAGKFVTDIADTEGRDPVLTFAAVKDRTYTVSVRDIDHRGYRNFTYRLALREGAASPTPPAPKSDTATRPGFQLRTAGFPNVPVGGKAALTITVVREGGFKEPIKLAVSGLPDGVTAPKELTVPPTGDTFALNLECAKDAPATAALVAITGTAKVGDATVTKPVLGELKTDLAPRTPEANRSPLLLVATTLKAPFKVKAAEADGGRRIPRGSTHLAPILIDRTDGFAGEIVLDMSAAQQRHRQGIRGPALAVPPGVKAIDYPVFLPEWLETTRTSRIGLNALALVPDAKGTPRWVQAAMEGQITMSIEGALLKVTHDAGELAVEAGQPFDLPLRLARSPKFADAVAVELLVPDVLKGLVSAKPLTLPPDKSAARLAVETKADKRLVGTWRLTVRATGKFHGHAVVSETTVEVEVTPTR